MGGYSTHFTEILLGILILLSLITFIGSLGKSESKRTDSSIEYSDQGYYDNKPDPYNDVYAP